MSICANCHAHLLTCMPHTSSHKQEGDAHFPPDYSPCPVSDWLKGHALRNVHENTIDMICHHLQIKSTVLSCNVGWATQMIRCHLAVPNDQPCSKQADAANSNNLCCHGEGQHVRHCRNECYVGETFLANNANIFHSTFQKHLVPLMPPTISYTHMHV